MRLHRRNSMPRKTKEAKEIENQNQALESEKKSTIKTTKKNTKTTTSIKKKSTTKVSAKKKKTTVKKVTSSRQKIELVEYYDLPYRYNQTIVKVLAQTPTDLFIYWDISDNDKKNFQNLYGEDFFERTKPILMIYNDTLGYHFEIEINDFANSWYLSVADSKCDYRVELGRRPIQKTEKLTMDYIYVTTSNEIESPNDRILFDHQSKYIYFSHVKTGEQTQKTISSFPFIRNIGENATINDFYQEIYGNENLEETDKHNPSSSQFK